MDGLLDGLVTLVADSESVPGFAVTLVGAAAWAVSLLVGWVTPVPFIDSLGRAAMSAAALSMALLSTGLALLVASALT